MPPAVIVCANRNPMKETRETFFLKRYSATVSAALSNIAGTERNKKQLITVLIDATIAVFSLWLAFSIRHGMMFSTFKPNWYLFLALPVLTTLIFASLGVYKWVVRSGNERLFLQLIKGSMLSALCLLVIMFLFPPTTSAPRSLFMIYGLILMSLAVCSRRIWQYIFHNQSDSTGTPVAIYGAGEAGRKLADLLIKQSKKQPVVFIDDDPRFTKATVAGIPVVDGSKESIKRTIDTHEIQEFILALPSVKGADYLAALEKVSDFELPVLTIPSVGELILNNDVNKSLREISMNDLLGRTEIAPDMDLMSKCVTGKRVLVTGGGGSIGSEICRQIIKLKPEVLVIIDHSEENVYKITEEITAILEESNNPEEKSNIIFVPTLGSIRNKNKVFDVIKTYKINTVYHAAAYKHVPIIEDYPEEAIETNIQGTLNVLDASIENNVANFTLISTDKAVRPTNYMGATKRVAEMILQAKADLDHNTTICMVRFGNVLGSSGSVVPKFKQQILEGGPITITHENITRYFMTIPEASQLVLQASALAKGGEVFVLDMGEPVKIIDLAKAMIRLSGKQLKTSTTQSNAIAIRTTGLRPGEKMYEELFIGNEPKRTSVNKILVAHENYVNWQQLNDDIHFITKATPAFQSSTHKQTALRSLATYSTCATDSITNTKNRRERASLVLAK